MIATAPPDGSPALGRPFAATPPGG